MVITKDFESFDPGSSPGRTFCMFLWPNWIRRLTTNQKIGGSSPSRDIVAALSLHGLMDKAHPS